MEGEDSDEEEELDDNIDDADQEIIFWKQNLTFFHYPASCLKGFVTRWIFFWRPLIKNRYEYFLYMHW